MKIEQMRPLDQITIQDAKILKGNYSIHWMAPVYFSDVLVCIKSSWLLYDEWIKILEDHCDETQYKGEKVYWEKVTKKTVSLIPISTIEPPIDVVLLPVLDGKILVPENKDQCANLQKTIKGVITCTHKKKFSIIDFFTFKTTQELKFINGELSSRAKEDEVVAEYSVDGVKYPVTVGMLGQTIVVIIPKKYKFQLSVSENMFIKYGLKINEE